MSDDDRGYGAIDPNQHEYDNHYAHEYSSSGASSLCFSCCLPSPPSSPLLAPPSSHRLSISPLAQQGPPLTQFDQLYSPIQQQSHQPPPPLSPSSSSSDVASSFPSLSSSLTALQRECVAREVSLFLRARLLPFDYSFPQHIHHQLAAFSFTSFAATNFVVARSSSFSVKRVPLVSALANACAHQNTLINKPLLESTKALDSRLNSVALKCFKLVMIFMVDYPTAKRAKTQAAVSAALLEATDRQEMIDEVYCQVIKQINNNHNNPVITSTLSGFKLLMLLSSTRTPSLRLRDPILAFCAEAACMKSTDAQIGEPPLSNYRSVLSSMASYCFWSVLKLYGRPSAQPPATLKDIEETILNGVKIYDNYFYTGLPYIMPVQRSSGIRPPIPLLLHCELELMRAAEAEQWKGIFVQRGPEEEIESLRLEYCRAEPIDVGRLALCRNLLAHGSLVVDWLESLYEPIIPSSLYNYCLQHSQDEPHQFQQLFAQLPADSLAVVKELAAFLLLLDASAAVTHQHLNDYSAIFCPHFIRLSSIPRPTQLAHKDKLETFFCNLMHAAAAAKSNKKSKKKK